MKPGEKEILKQTKILSIISLLIFCVSSTCVAIWVANINANPDLVKWAASTIFFSFILILNCVVIHQLNWLSQGEN